MDKSVGSVVPAPVAPTTVLPFYLGIAGLGAVAYFTNLYIALALGGLVMLTVLTDVVRFQPLYFLLISCIYILNPPVANNERYFAHGFQIGPLYLQDFLLFATLYLCVLQLLVRRTRIDFRIGWIGGFLAAYGICFLISTVVALRGGNPLGYVVGDVRDFLYLLLFFAWVWLSDSVDEIETAFHVFLFFTALASVGSLIDAAVTYNLERYNSAINAPMLGGLMVALAMVATPGYKVSRIWMGTMLGCVLIGILIAFNRGSFLAIGVGFAAMLVLVGSRYALRLGVVFTAAVGLMLAVIGTIGLSLDRILVQTTERGGKVVGNLGISSIERLLEIFAVIEAFPQHPIFGAGPGATVYVFRFGSGDVVKRGMIDWWYIHNGYAQLLHESGLAGFIAYMGVWTMALYSSARLYRKAQSPKSKMLLLSVFGAAVVYLVQALTTPALTTTTFNFLLALLFAAVAVVEKHERLPAQKTIL